MIRRDGTPRSRDPYRPAISAGHPYLVTWTRRSRSSRRGSTAGSPAGNCSSSGWVEDAIDYRLKRSRFHVLFPGVYAVGHAATTREGRWMAAVLVGGPGAALSQLRGRSALGDGPERSGAHGRDGAAQPREPPRAPLPPSRSSERRGHGAPWDPHNHAAAHPPRHGRGAAAAAARRPSRRGGSRPRSTRRRCCGSGTRSRSTTCSPATRDTAAPGAPVGARAPQSGRNAHAQRSRRRIRRVC